MDQQHLCNRRPAAGETDDIWRQCGEGLAQNPVSPCGLGMTGSGVVALVGDGRARRIGMGDGAVWLRA